MARISTYVIDGTIVDGDKVIGSDANNDMQTKNYTVGDLVNYFAASIGGNFLVPYVGANDDVDLGAFNLSATEISVSGNFISNGSAGLPGQVLLSQGPGSPAIWGYSPGTQDLLSVLNYGNTGNKNINLVTINGYAKIDVEKAFGEPAMYLYSDTLGTYSNWGTDNLHLESPNYIADYLTNKIRYQFAGNYVDIIPNNYNNQAFYLPIYGGYIPISVNGNFADSSGNIVVSGGGGGVSGSGTATQVAFWDTSSSLTSNSLLYWDNNNNWLGVGNPTPEVRLHVGDGGGSMGFPYEEAIVEKTGDTKFGVYTSADNPGAGGASYTLGYTKFTTNLGYYPGFEYQLVGNAIDDDNYIRYNFLQRDLAGAVVLANPNIFNIYGDSRVSFKTLIGTGSRMVVTDAAGFISSQAISTSPLTTKGDLYTFSTVDDRLPVGLNTQVLLADSTTATGLRWGTNTAATPTGYYGAFSDVTDQFATVINTGYPMLLGVTDLTNGVTVVSGSRVTIANTGIYNIQWSAQFRNPTAQIYDVTIWLRKNGVDVPGSSGIVAVTAKHGSFDGHVLPSWNFLLDAIAGDYYEFVWSTQDTAVFISFEPAGSPPPSTASVVLTVTQQSGIMAGTGITDINALSGASQTIVAGTSGTDFAVSSAGTTHTLNLPTASVTNRGALSSADYSKFSNSQSLNGFQALGSTFKGITLTTPDFKSTGANALSNQTLYLVPVYIPISTIITGVKFMQTVQGVFTANNYNGVGLYSHSGGTLTLVASSTNDGNFWKGTNNTWQTKPFSSTYSAAVGTYYIGMLYNTSAQTTAPTISVSQATTGNNLWLLDLTNSNKLSSTVPTQFSLPASQAMSGANGANFMWGIFVY